MPKEIDVYRDWLGITETARPLNYYQLLRLNPFEDNVSKIRTHYRRMNAHVRKFASGDYAAQSQQLLNELARAMLCLTDARRKSEYDASLGRKAAEEGRRRTLEEILLANQAISSDQLAKARTYAHAVGLEIRDALVQQKAAAPDVIALAYAESLGLPYVELEDVGVDEQLAPRVPAALARQHSCIPVMIDDRQLLMASSNPLLPDVEEELRLRFNMPVRTVLCTAGSINAVMAKYYPREAAAAAPAAAAAGKRAAAEKAAARVDAKPVTREEWIKQRIVTAVITFNVVVILYMGLWMFFRSGAAINQYFGALPWAVLLGLVAAGAAFGIRTYMKQ